MADVKLRDIARVRHHRRIILACSIVSLLNFTVLYFQRNNIDQKENSSFQQHREISSLMATGDDKKRLEFTLENMLETSHHRCGTWKCLFPLKVNPQLGYLVAAEPFLETTMKSAWHFTQVAVEGEFQMQHIYLGQPQKIAIQDKPELRAWLDRNKTGTDDQVRPDVPRFGVRETVVVQMVEILQAPVFFGGSHRKLNVGYEQAKQWLQGLFASSDMTRKELDKVRDRFATNVAQLNGLLKRHPCLYSDFQIFIRRNGQLVHLDLDRCFLPDSGHLQLLPMEQQQAHQERIDRFAKLVLLALDRGDIPKSFAPLGNKSLSSELVSPSIQNKQPRQEGDPHHLEFVQANLRQGINHRCGAKKCFYPLQNDDNLAYVAGTAWFLPITLSKSYNFTKCVIQDQYGMQHLAVQPPKRVSLSKSVAAFLDKNKTGSDDLYRKNVPHFAQNETAMVQLVKVISTDTALFWGSSDKKMVIGWNQMHTWLQPLLDGPPRQRMKALRRFHNNAKRLFQLLRDYPCVLDDFQIFVRAKGEMVHFDIDRCFQTQDFSMVIPHTDALEIFRNRVQAMVWFVTEALANGRLPPGLVATTTASNNTPSVFSHTLAVENGTLSSNNVSALTCDDSKCLFPTRSNPQIGYLLTRNNKTLHSAWNYTLHVIEHEYNMKHVYLSPPEFISVEEVWKRELANEKLAAAILEGKETSTAIVQRVHIPAPDTVLLFEFNQDKLNHAWTQLRAWLQQIVSNSSGNNGEHRMALLHNFERSHAQLLVLLRYQPCLLNKFEILLDQQTGELFHLNVGRCFDKKSGIMSIPEEQVQESTKASIREMAHFTSLALRTGRVPPAISVLARR